MGDQFMDVYDFGMLLRERRRDLGLSQAEVATQIGASRQWVIDIEKGKERAELGMALKLAEALGIQLKAQKKIRSKQKVELDSKHKQAEELMQNIAASMSFLEGK